MTDLYILRHGDTTESGNLFFRLFGHKGSSFNLPILPKGLPPLQKIGEYLKSVPTEANFCSPYIRCVDSAKVVGKIADKKFDNESRISEFERNGEGFGYFYKRVKNFFDDIKSKKYSSVSICTHGAVIAALKHLATGRSFHRLQIWDFPKPGNLIVIKDSKVEILNFNY
jgi:broad specificity phosphatase PhoE